MDNTKVFKVVFRGVILPGFEKDQVIDNVHQITRIPKETITRKFFSGKTVVIRRADSQEYASRLQKTFSQAGIETYIEELVETVETSGATTDYSLKTETTNSAPPESSKAKKIIPTEKNKASKYILIFSGLSFTVIISAVYFLFFGNNSGINELPTKQPIVITDQPVNVEKKPTAVDIPPESDLLRKGTPFFNNNSIVTLIQVSDHSQKKRLIEFLPLFNIKAEVRKLLETTINQNQYISPSRPIILFKTNKNTGILLPINQQVEHQTIKEIKEQLRKLHLKNAGLSICQTDQSFSLLSSDSALLISDFSETDIKASEKVIFKSILHTSKRFNNIQMPDSLNFKLFYALPGSLFIGSNSNQLWLHSDTPVTQANSHLFAQTQLKPDVLQDINKTVIKSLATLVQMISSQYHAENKFIDDGLSSDTFNQEYIAEIKPTSKPSQFKNYNNQLDPELKAQWQKGPFALTTKSIQFSDQIIIQLLAKGQNIPNYMEYSHQANITPYAVYNDKKTNLLDQACNPSKQQSRYFKNLDGEQEAYINDDFVSFFTINAISNVPVKPGVQLADIKSIDGSIEINLPEQIKQDTIQNTARYHLKHFEHFSLMTQLVDASTIRYQVIGNHAYFLTVRAFNKAGEILDTESFHSFKVDNDIHLFQQNYSDTIDKVKIYYSEKNKLINYDFSIKPEIKVSATSLTSIKKIDSDPVVFNSSELSLNPLNDDIKNDNPEWLGRKIKEQNLFPFYLSLFTPNSLNNTQDNNKEFKDALLNIKTSETPLIEQNLTSVRLILNKGKDILFNEYVTFIKKTVTSQEPVENGMKGLEPDFYLNTDAAFQYQRNNLENINGTITLNLPTALKQHSTPYLSPGQSIKLDGILIKPIQIDSQQIRFEVSGKINDLVQLRLYNKNNELISEAIEFKQIKADLAHLSLLYSDKIDSIKLFVAKVTVQKEYPITFTK